MEGYNMMSLFSLAKIKQDPSTQEIMGALHGENLLKRPLPPSQPDSHESKMCPSTKKQKLSEPIEIETGAKIC